MLLGLTIGLNTACGPLPASVEPGVSLELAQFRSGVISNLNYRLSFDIPAQFDEEIKGHIVISLELADVTQAMQLDFRESEDKIKRVVSNGRTSTYAMTNEHVVIPKSELAAGFNEIEIEFTAGSQSLNRNPEYLYTLFVPDRARTAFPLFDQPDLKATYELTLRVPTAWVAMSNAPVESITDTGTRTEYRFRKTDLVSSYLFSFVAGDFQSVTRERNGRSMTMLHRETDTEKLQRNLDAIFDLHAAAIDWLEAYTGIDYPYQKFDFALIPSFQYGGMEHVGAIQYRASNILLDESPSDRERLNRASLIAHETAHMWFGNLVTMEWFNDVWTKEVFANFMAAKIVNPNFPEINHDLNFLVRHHPGAYAVDRTPGANPIRQHLDNLEEAGQMYGAIIYNKAPIMMRQLEALLGEDQFREGMREYLRTYSFDNATWPNLIAILGKHSEQDLQAWSDIWVNTSGRPEIVESTDDKENGASLLQIDTSGRNRVWPQEFEVTAHSGSTVQRDNILSIATATPVSNSRVSPEIRIIFNSNGFGYGLFPASLDNLKNWGQLNEVEKGTELINLYEQFLEHADADVQRHFTALQIIIGREKNQLLLDLALGQLQRIYWSFLTPDERIERAPALEDTLCQEMLSESLSSRKKIHFDAFSDIAISPGEIQKIYNIWSGDLNIDNLNLSEDDYIAQSQLLAIKLPERASAIVAAQIERTGNPDNKRKLRFLTASLSPDQAERDRFFSSLTLEGNRQIESWVLDALQNLHHPLRSEVSEHYILPSLELLQEIQTTGDIFFPKNWLDATLENYNSSSAADTVSAFLQERPDYNEQLRMKILQSADMMTRANRIISATR